MDKFWDEHHPVGEVVRSAKSKILVARARRGAAWYIDVRNWYIPANSEEWSPSKGIAIPEAVAADVYRLIGEAVESHQSTRDEALET